jgi:hypothetical protein
MKLPRVAWITPTYKRPQHLPNLIACFLAQDYPRELLRLHILDDANQYGRGCAGDRWRVTSYADRVHSLPAKFNWLCRIARNADVIVVAEDDDSFLPWHTLAHVTAMQHGGGFSKPSRVFSDYPGHVVEEPAAGRFHGSIALRRELWLRCGGWPDTQRADFDQHAMRVFETAAGGVCDPCEAFPPSYVFRWHTGTWHGQAQADGPGCENWYQRVAQFTDGGEPVHGIEPQFDEFTRKLYMVHDDANGDR